MIDFYRNSGEGLPHYIAIIRKKQEQHKWIRAVKIENERTATREKKLSRAHLSEGNIHGE